MQPKCKQVGVCLPVCIIIGKHNSFVWSSWSQNLCTLTPLTFPFAEVEGAQKPGGRRHLRHQLSSQLGELVPWQIYEPSNITKHQIRENLRMLMPEPLHKEVRVKDHRLVRVWFFVTEEHAAICLPVKKQTLTPSACYYI